MPYTSEVMPASQAHLVQRVRQLRCQLLGPASEARQLAPVRLPEAPAPCRFQIVPQLSVASLQQAAAHRDSSALHKQYRL